MSSYTLSDSIWKAIATRINSHYPLIHKPNEKQLAYGTAGFRTTGVVLPPVAARVIAVAVLRAWHCTAALRSNNCPGGAAVGFVITASHNPAVDNGFKIVDTDGGMLDPAWEPWCTKAANAVTGENLVEVLKECMLKEKVVHPGDAVSCYGTVQIGRDTRASGDTILRVVKDMLDSVLCVSYTDHGLVTTPQLHFCVLSANDQTKKQQTSVKVDVNHYNYEVIAAFDALMKIALGGEPLSPQTVVIDASNGVGALGLQQLLQFSENTEVNGWRRVLAKYLDVHLVNTNTSNPALLNCKCGAEFAHKNRKPSHEMQEWAETREKQHVDENVHYYCVDGDADRLVSFSHPSGSPSWNLIDGDRISILYALLLHHWLPADVLDKLDIGVVQTAYANGASTVYLQEKLKMKVYMAATGVKNLHPVAHARDVGVYFESNGHGTVLFNERIRGMMSAGSSCSENVMCILETMPKLLSQVCGDAVADMLMCEIAFRALQMSPQMWEDLYTDRPSSQTTVTVPNPRVITNTKDETRALTPPGLQEAIDNAVTETERALHESGEVNAAARSFVRPSGTEPIVRVYAEATTSSATSDLAQRVQKLVTEFCS